MAHAKEKETFSKANLLYLPEEIMLKKTNEKVTLDFCKDSDYDRVYDMLKDVVEEGLHFASETIDRERFDDYYLLSDNFVIRDSKNKDVLGFFYIKPNFPGRSSHICKAGFVVNKHHRQKGIGEVLYKKYLTIARDLGYEGSLFNLVYSSNEGSVRICRKLGFTEIGRVPKAGKIKGLGYVDALQFYYDLTTLDQRNALPC